MSKEIIYRKQLLQAVDAFLEATPTAYAQAQRIIQQCYISINEESKRATLDDIIWGFFIVALTDSVYNKNEEPLREMQEMLLGHSSRSIARTLLSDDYREEFTLNEVEWYAQLVSLVNFVAAIPSAEIYKAAYQARQEKESWQNMCTHIPEVIQAEKIEEEYQQRKAIIGEIAAKSPLPENAGDEKIYHLVLREVTEWLINLSVGRAVVYFGHPIFSGQVSYHISTSSTPEGIDANEYILRAKKFLEAISGKGEMFISWHLNKAATFDADMLFISLY